MHYEEKIRTRIHSFRMPIKNKRVLFAVQCMYFVTPLALGSMVMSYVIPSPEEMRKQIKPPTPEQQAVIDAHKRRLQEEMDAALAARAAKQQG